MNQRGIIAFLLAAAMLCCFAGCSEKETRSDNRAEKRLVIGSDIYAPYFYIDDNGDFTGIDVEIAHEACGRMNIQPVFKKIAWQNKDVYLENGAVDCLWGSFTINGREELYSWAGPYLKSRQVAVVRADSDIYRLSDLSGKRIAVQNGSKPEELFLNNKLPQIIGLENVYSLPSVDTVFAALRKGYVDACAGHEAAYRELIKNSGGEYRVLEEPLLQADLGVAFYRESASPIKAELTKVLKEMGADGTIEKIISPYGLGNSGLTGE